MHNSVFIHPSAIVETGSTIEEGSKIWHFCHVMPTAQIGKNCSLGQNVFVADRVNIGNGVKIQNNVSLYEGLICEDDVFIGPSVVFTNILNPRSFIVRKNEYKPTLLKKGCSIGANATILCGIEIGAFAMIGAGAVVTRSVPAHALVKGNPARISGYVSHAGHTLQFDTQNRAICKETKQAYELKGSELIKINTQP
jgi:UDP-2-acetamido-3-amino-2,3-dideoxy-glucuronate N-acetyltransferase